MAWGKAAVKVQDKDKEVAVGKVADEAWVVGVDAVWGAVAALLVPAASASVPIAARLLHISKACLALR